MMELIREWLLGITGAAILTALAEGLIPEGESFRAGRLVCGLVLLLAVLRPLCGANLSDFSDQIGRGEERLQWDMEKLQRENDAQLRSLIEQRLEAYSMEQAAILGINCQVDIECLRHEGGLFLPDSAHISGLNSDLEQEQVKSVLTEQLGLSEKQISVQEG